jgi:hypothetical protein
VQRASVELSGRAQEVLQALRDVTGDPLTLVALRALTATVRTLNVQLRYLGPQITVCNSWNMFWTFAGEHLSERDPTGTAQRSVNINGDHQDNAVTDQGAIVPANGENVQRGGIPQYFHGQPYGHAVDAQGNADCEDGQRGYLPSLDNQFATPELRKRFGHVVSPASPRTPGSQGPYFDHFANGKGVGLGPRRVPPGETFTAEPQGLAVPLP